jgi:hypothetical protein
MMCPKCGLDRAHRSHRSFLDWGLSLIALKPYRCRDCHHRFYAYKSGSMSAKMRTPEERRVLKLRRRIRWKRTRGELVLYAISSLIFLAVLYYLLQQRVTGG